MPRILSQKDVISLLSMPDVIQAVEDGFIACSNGEYNIPVRLPLEISGHEAVVLFMPAHLPQTGTLGAKIVSVYPSNPSRNMPVIMGVYLLYEEDTGRLLAIMDATYLTGIRTAAASAVATKYLARGDSRILGVFGAGVQARFHIKAICSVLNIQEIIVYNRTRQHGVKVIEHLKQHYPSVQLADTPEACVERADVIATCTNATTPLFKHKSVQPGTHINAVGAYTPDMRELSTDTICRSMHGYQVEIETSPRKWAGGIYDESRRMWMYPLAGNPEGQEAFKRGAWNKYYIEAIGPNIRTWVNGVACSRLVDDLTAEGIIAFQVHSIGDSSQAGKEVRWRNIRIKEVSADHKGRKSYKRAPEISFLLNTLTEHEEKDGWQLLSNWQEVDVLRGRQSTGWQNGSPAGQLDSRNGALGGKDVATQERHSDFILNFDFKVNSGGGGEVMYLVGDEFLLGFKITDETKISDELMMTGALTGLIAPGNLSEVNNDKRRYWGADIWNKGRVVCKNRLVEHWINNVKVLEVKLDDSHLRDLLSNQGRSSMSSVPETGYLQFHQEGEGVSFRSIKLKSD